MDELMSKSEVSNEGINELEYDTMIPPGIQIKNMNDRLKDGKIKMIMSFNQVIKIPGK